MAFNWLWNKIKPPTEDAQKIGQAFFNILRPPTEDIKTISRALPKVESPFEARRKTGEWAFNKLRKTTTDYFKPTAEVRRRDVWREMPSTGTKMLKLGTTMREEMAKSGGSLGLSLMNIFNDLQGKKRVSAFKPREDAPKIERGIHQFVFGKEPVKSIERRIFEGEKTARKIGEEYGIKSMEKYPLAFSAVGVGAIISLDFTGFGGGKKQAVKLIAKMDDVADISKLLRQMGVAEDLVLPTAKKMKTIKSEVQILNALDKIEVLQKSTKIKPIRPSDKFLETMRRPKEVEMSEKQFVDNFINKNFGKDEKGYFDYVNGVFKRLTTKEIKFWQNSAKENYKGLMKAKGIEATKPTLPKPVSKIPAELEPLVDLVQKSDSSKIFRDSLKSGSYPSKDVIKARDLFFKTTVSKTYKTVPDRVLKTKLGSQLKEMGIVDLDDFFNVVKKAKPDPLITEARKYKSAEEFVKSQPKGIVFEGEFFHATDDIGAKSILKSKQFKPSVEGGGGLDILPDFGKGSYFDFDYGNVGQYGERIIKAKTKGKLLLYEADSLADKGFVQKNVSKLKKQGYDGAIYRKGNLAEQEVVIFEPKNKVIPKYDIGMTADENAYDLKTQFQSLTDIYNKAKIPEVKKGVYTKLLEKKLLTTPDIAGEGFVMRPTKKKGFTPATQIKREVAKSVKEVAEKKVAVEALKITKKGLSGFDNFIDITKIKRKAIPYKEMNIAENIVGDKTFPAIRKSGFYADKEIQSAIVRDIYNQKLSPHLMALKQDGYKLGGKFGTVFSKVWKPTEKAIRVEKEFNSKNVRVILELGKKYKIKATKKNLEYLSDVVEKKVKGTPNEELYVKELRKTLDGLREEANVVREAMGKNRMGYIENYIPHIQKANIWSELLANKATISDNLDFIIPNQTKNPFAYKRMLEEMVKPERNLYTLLDRYIGVIGKDIYYTPAIENIKAYNGVLKSREKIKAAQYWDEYIRQGLVGKQHKIDTALGTGKKTQKKLQKWNDMVNKAFLTGKVAWNIATQPLSYMMPGISEIGVKNSIKGIYKGLSKPMRQYVKENSNVLNIKSSDVHAIAVGEGRGIQNRIYRTKIDKWNDFISMIGAVEERLLTRASYIGGLERAKGLGYKGDDALWFADLSAAKSQSMYNRENRALILNSDITRTIFPFQSFSIEMFNHAKEVFTKTGGAYQLSGRQRVGKLFGLVVGMYLANKYSEELTGKKKTTIGTFVPFLGGTVIDPMIAKIKGEQYYGGRSPITVIQIGEDIIKGSKDYIKHGSTKRLRKIGVNFGLALGGMGGGGQINNLIDGIMANIDEDVKNVSGDVMFEVKDLESKIKAPIFGVWATKEGIEYWKPKEKTPYDKAVSEDKEKDKKEKEALQPKFDEIDRTQSEELLNALTEREYKIYKKQQSAEKTKDTNKKKEEFYPTFLKIREVGEKDEAEAMKIIDSLTDEEYRIYELLRAQLE